jgi:branched-chain amino acid aminotransferase
MNLTKFSLNGKVLPIKKANISALNIEYQYGFGVYETVRVNNGILFFLPQHMNRLMGSAKIVGIEHPFSGKELIEYTEKLIKKLKENTCNLKFILIGGNTKENCLIYIFPSSPLFPDRKLLKNGTSVITTNFERIFPQAKTLNMLQSYIAYKKAKQNNCHDALGIDRTGFIREGTRTNFFAIKGNIIYKAPKETILDGVTQRVVLSVASNNGYEIQEGNIRKEDLKDFDGFFLTSTSIKVMPISKIDDMVFPVPESINKLRVLVNTFFDNCKGIFKDES